MKMLQIETLPKKENTISSEQRFCFLEKWRKNYNNGTNGKEVRDGKNHDDAHISVFVFTLLPQL